MWIFSVICRRIEWVKQHCLLIQNQIGRMMPKCQGCSALSLRAAAQQSQIFQQSRTRAKKKKNFSISEGSSGLSQPVGPLRCPLVLTWSRGWCWPPLRSSRRGTAPGWRHSGRRAAASGRRRSRWASRPRSPAACRCGRAARGLPVSPAGRCARRWAGARPAAGSTTARSSPPCTACLSPSWGWSRRWPIERGGNDGEVSTKLELLLPSPQKMNFLDVILSLSERLQF